MSIYCFHIALGIVGYIFTMCKKTEGESAVKNFLTLFFLDAIIKSGVIKYYIKGFRCNN